SLHAFTCKFWSSLLILSTAWRVLLWLLEARIASLSSLTAPHPESPSAIFGPHARFFCGREPHTKAPSVQRWHRPTRKRFRKSGAGRQVREIPRIHSVPVFRRAASI